MNKRTKVLVTACMTLSILATQFASTKNVFAGSNTIRFYGADRYETAVSVSKGNWTSSEYAILARGDEFPDALCAGPLAKAYNAPILLTETKQLNTCVANELKRLNAKTIFIVGGTGAVSQAVENSLKTMSGVTVKRLFGTDRFGTSEAIANQVKLKLGSVNKAAVAYAYNYPDALSISAIAANMGMPILLTDVNQLPTETSKFIKDNNISQSYVVGGSGVISDKVKVLLPNAKRLGGIDRFATNVEVMKEFQNNIDFSKVYAAVGDGPRGDEFADALSGSAAAAMSKSPVLLTYKTVAPSIAGYINGKLGTNTVIAALGGVAVLPQSIVDQLVGYTSNGIVKAISLKDGTTGEVKANIIEPAVNGKDGLISFNVTASGITRFTTGSAKISVDLDSATIKNDKINKTVTNIRTTDNFVDIVFAAMEEYGYNPNDGILASNVKTILNGSVITLTDKAGNVKVYSIEIK